MTDVIPHANRESHKQFEGSYRESGNEIRGRTSVQVMAAPGNAAQFPQCYVFRTQIPVIALGAEISRVSPLPSQRAAAAVGHPSGAVRK